MSLINRNKLNDRTEIAWPRESFLKTIN